MAPDWWLGDDVFNEIAQRMINAVDEIDMEIVNEAKGELYPGHGLITGNLRRSLAQEAASLNGTRVVGAVGSGVNYAKAVHKRYKYFIRGKDKVAGRVPNIIRRNVGGG